MNATGETTNQENKEARRQTGFTLPAKMIAAIKIEAIRDNLGMSEWAEKVFGRELDSREVSYK
jgi:hypothetical protein